MQWFEKIIGGCIQNFVTETRDLWTVVPKMASKEIAAMLDTLMGKNRNTEVSSNFPS